MSAYSELARAVDKIHHAEEQRLTAIRHAIQKAITANELEGQRTFDKLTNKRNPNWAAVAREGHHTNSIRAELKNALETVEACIQQHWERERHAMRRLPPLVQLLDFGTGPQRALVAEEFAGRFLAHREKARLRDRRYRERRSASEGRGEAARRSMERINARRVAPAWDTRRMDKEPKTVLHRELERRAPGAGTSNTQAPPAEVAK